MKVRKSWKSQLNALRRAFLNWRRDVRESAANNEPPPIDMTRATQADLEADRARRKALQRLGKLKGTHPAMLESTLFVVPDRCVDQLDSLLESDPSCPEQRWLYDSPVVWARTGKVRQASPDGSPAEDLHARMLLHGDREQLPVFLPLAHASGELLKYIPRARLEEAGLGSLGEWVSSDPVENWVWAMSCASWKHPHDSIYGGDRTLRFKDYTPLDYKGEVISEAAAIQAVATKRLECYLFAEKPSSPQAVMLYPPLPTHAPWMIEVWNSYDLAMRSRELLGVFAGANDPHDLEPQKIAAEKTGNSPRQLRRWIAHGDVPTYGPRGQVSLAELQRLAPGLRKRRSVNKPAPTRVVGDERAKSGALKRPQGVRRRP